MKLKIIFIFAAIGIVFAAIVKSEETKHKRQIPVTVTCSTSQIVFKADESIPLTITIQNGLSFSIYHESFSVVPLKWNGETFNIQLVDIYRNGSPNLYQNRPVVKWPINMSRIRRHEISPNGSLVIETDAKKWALRDSWLPGHYRIVMRVDNLKVDDYSTLTVLSEPIEFEIE